MDPVSSGLTILGAIRSSVAVAKKLYDAPRELERLQAEIATFTIVLTDVIAESFEQRTTSDALNASIIQTQACLLEIQQLIQYKLIKEAPEGGKKVRRLAWRRRADDVDDLLERLGDCRENVVLAFEGVRSKNERRSEAKLREISQSLLDLRTDSQRNQTLFMEQWSQNDQQLKAHMAMSENQLKRICHFIEAAISGSDSPVMPWAAIGYRSDDRLLRGPESSLSDDNDAATMNHTSLSGPGSSRIATFSGQPRKLPRLPTTVLYVGDENSGIRLCRCSFGERAKYVALSYCLGYCDLMAAHGTSISGEEGIAWDSLPPLFQMVILVTRRFGIRYLWIDALCMVEYEWTKGSSRITKILRNATVGLVVMPTAFASWPILLPEYRGQEGPHISSLIDVAKMDGRTVHSSDPRKDSSFREFWTTSWNNRHRYFPESVLTEAVVGFVAGEVSWSTIVSPTSLVICEKCAKSEASIDVIRINLEHRQAYRLLCTECFYQSKHYQSEHQLSLINQRKLLLPRMPSSAADFALPWSKTVVSYYDVFFGIQTRLDGRTVSVDR